MAFPPRSHGDTELRGKLYPWIEEEYGPAPPHPRDAWIWMRRDSEQVARERAEILQAEIEARW